MSTLAIVVLVALGVAAQDADWRRGLDPARGYTPEQTSKLNELFSLETWQVTADYDYARYSMQRIAELFAHVVIPRSGPVSALSVAARPEIGRVVAETPLLGRATLEEYLEKSQTDAFIVVHRGRIVYEKYPRIQPSTKHIYWSVSKTFAGLLVAQLEAEGRVDVTKPIEFYIPNLAMTDWRGTRIIDILDQASGMDALENDESNTWERPQLAVFQFESTLGLLRPTPAANRSTYDLVASIRRLRPAGERFEYLSVNTFVLGWLVERVTGRSYGDVLADRIWSRMGAEQDAVLVVAPRTGAAASHGGIAGTLRDLARYGVLHAPSWRLVASNPVVPPAYIEKLQKGGRRELVERSAPGSKALTIEGFFDAAQHETYQWDAVWADGDFFKAGFRGQGLYISPSKDLVVAFFSAQRQSQHSYARALATSGLFAGQCNGRPSVLQVVD